MPSSKQHPTNAQLAVAAGIAPTPLFHTYMLVFDSFAIDTKEVATAFGISSSVALKALHRLEEVGLIVGQELHDTGGMSVSGEGMGRARGTNRKFIPLTWQALQTYDNLSSEEAVKLFAERVPPVQIGKDYKVPRKAAAKKAPAKPADGKLHLTGSKAGTIEWKKSSTASGAPTAQSVAAEHGWDGRKFRRFLRSQGLVINTAKDAKAAAKAFKAHLAQ